MTADQIQEKMTEILELMGWTQGAIVMDGGKIVAVLMGEDSVMEVNLSVLSKSKSEFN